MPPLYFFLKENYVNYLGFYSIPNAVLKFSEFFKEANLQIPANCSLSLNGQKLQIYQTFSEADVQNFDEINLEIQENLLNNPPFSAAENEKIGNISRFLLNFLGI